MIFLSDGEPTDDKDMLNTVQQVLVPSRSGHKELAVHCIGFGNGAAGAAGAKNRSQEDAASTRRHVGHLDLGLRAPLPALRGVAHSYGLNAAPSRLFGLSKPMLVRKIHAATGVPLLGGRGHPPGGQES